MRLQGKQDMIFEYRMGFIIKSKSSDKNQIKCSLRQRRPRLGDSGEGEAAGSEQCLVVSVDAGNCPCVSRYIMEAE